MEEKVPSLLMLPATKRAHNILDRDISSGQVGPSGESVPKQPPRENRSSWGDFQLPKDLEVPPARKRAVGGHQQPIS